MEHDRIGKREGMQADKMQDDYLASILRAMPEDHVQHVENL
jgi:hypothetical protein